MCTCFLRRAIGIGALCFGAGVLFAFILPGLMIAFLEAAVILFAGLMLCAKDDRCTVTGVEIDPAAHAAALDNIARNDLSHRLNSVCADLRVFSPEHGAYHVCVSNPPYFSGGPASATHPVARQDDTCPPEE